MDRKRSSGRQKIAIKRILKESDRFATFSKRRLGLVRKASELSTLCSVDIGIVIYSPTGKPFSFFHPTMESIMSCLQYPSRPLNGDASRLLEAFSRNRVRQLNQMLHKLAGQLQAEEQKEKQLDEEICRAGSGHHHGWWDEPVEELDEEGVRQMKMWLEELKAQLGEELKARSYSS